MGYQQSIEANGLVVKEFKEFGSYQGTWIAVLEDGRFVEGSYGSCSGCDAFEGEFGCNDEPRERDGKFFKNWDDEITKEEFDLLKEQYLQKLKDFGMGYVNSAETKDLILARYKKRSEGEYAWEDDKEIYEWIKSINN